MMPDLAYICNNCGNYQYSDGECEVCGNPDLEYLTEYIDLEAEDE